MHKQRQYRGGYEFSGLVKLARELRKSQTSAEALLWDLLRDRRFLGYKFRRQHQFGSYVADCYCREAQLVIECDGSAHQGNESWHHDQNRNVYMISQGLSVMRFSNEEILIDTEGVLSNIAERLTQGKGG
jgi:very-short-patch-repair endonuclease